jgi:hypothetical protein
LNSAITFKCIRAEKDSQSDFEKDMSEYPLDLFIDEVRRIGDAKAIVSFTLRSSAKTGLASFHIAGEMHLQGSQSEISAAVSSSGKEPPSIWKSIYDESYKMLIALAKLIDVPLPLSDAEKSSVVVE